MRRANGAGTEDDFFTLDGKGLSAAFHLHGNRFFAVENQAINHAIRLDREVQAMSSQVEIAQRRAPADTVGIVARHGSNTGGVGVIVIRAQGKSGRLASVVKGPLVRQPLVRLKAPGNDGPIGAMKVAIPEIRVRLDLAEELEAMLKVPLIVAHRCPRVVILRNTAQKDLAVDRARAAGDLTPRHEHGRRLVGGSSHELPVVVTDHNVRGRGIAMFELAWQVVDVGVIGPSFQQQDRALWVFAEAGGDDRARRACP